MIHPALTILHEQAQQRVDEMEKDGTATAYPADYATAKDRADFYASAAMDFGTMRLRAADGSVIS